MAAVLEAASGGQSQAAGQCGRDCVSVRTEDEATVVQLTCRRLHRKAERDQVVGPSWARRRKPR